MTKLQKIYRELRKHTPREDARYAAPRLLDMGEQWVREQAKVNHALGRR